MANYPKLSVTLLTCTWSIDPRKKKPSIPNPETARIFSAMIPWFGTFYSGLEVLTTHRHTNKDIYKYLHVHAI